jgi:hypothetical protein
VLVPPVRNLVRGEATRGAPPPGNPLKVAIR